MTRWQYCLYFLRRVLQAMLFAVGIAIAVAIAQWATVLPKSNWKPAIRPVNQLCIRMFSRPVIRAPLAKALEFWTYPLLLAFLGHVFFGQKQRRPVYLKYGEGIARAYAGVKQDFNDASRGDFITGATGTGKTQICLNPINESQTVHMCGIERDGWRGSEARKDYEALKKQFLRQTAHLRRELIEACDHRDHVREREYPMYAEKFASLLFRYLVRAYNDLNGASLTEAAQAAADARESEPTSPRTLGAEDIEDVNAADALHRTIANFAKKGASVDPELLRRVLDETSAAALLIERPLKLPPDAPKDLLLAGAEWQKGKQAVLDAEDAIEIVQNKISLRRLELSRAADILRPLRYANYPWGGAVYDQKGNCYQQQQPMLERHDRPEDIIVLQVRPRKAPPSWVPANTINILSYDGFPAETYAKIIVDTYNQVEECDKPDPFFVPAARDALCGGVKLLRAIRDAQLSLPIRPPKIVVPALDQIYRLLKDYTPAPNMPPGSGGQTYITFMRQVGAMQTPAMEKNNVPPLLNTPELIDAIELLRTSYWTQPAEQLGGVAKTLDNFIAPFAEPAIAEIFCQGNTCNFTDVERGKIFTISIPQRFALQRVYINTVISSVIYQIIQERFDLNKETSHDWRTRNILRQEKDEAQRLATNADTNTDTIREAQGSTGLASQSHDAMWKRFGGREKAEEPLSNLRNRFACRAATYNCAEATAKIISKGIFRESSVSGKSGENLSVSSSFKDHYFVTPERLLTLPDFNVIFAPAGKTWAYLHVIPCPIQPDGYVPFWWYGEANLFKILAKYLHLPRRTPAKILGIPMGPLGRLPLLWFDPKKVHPFWKGKCWAANKRVGIRYLLGLDTTWYIVEKMKQDEARKLANNRSHLRKN